MVRSVSGEWLKTPVNLKVVAEHLKSSVAIFSDDDPYVPIDNKDDFENVLRSKVVVEHGKGHFGGSTGTTELPVALESVLEIAGE